STRRCGDSARTARRCSSSSSRSARRSRCAIASWSSITGRCAGPAAAPMRPTWSAGRSTPPAENRRIVEHHELGVAADVRGISPWFVISFRQPMGGHVAWMHRHIAARSGEPGGQGRPTAGGSGWGSAVVGDAASPLVEIERAVQERAKDISLEMRAPGGEAQLRALIVDEVDRWNDDHRRGRRAFALADPDVVVERAFRNLARYGPLSSLLADDDVWEI